MGSYEKIGIRYLLSWLTAAGMNSGCGRTVNVASEGRTKVCGKLIGLDVLVHSKGDRLYSVERIGLACRSFGELVLRLFCVEGEIFEHG